MITHGKLLQEQPETCDHCNKKFGTKQALKWHKVACIKKDTNQVSSDWKLVNAFL